MLGFVEGLGIWMLGFLGYGFPFCCYAFGCSELWI